MTAFEWHEDVLRTTRTHLFEDIARTAALGYDTTAFEAIVLAKPYIVHNGDVLKITRRPAVLDWLLRRVAPPAELAAVRHAGGTFTWVERGWAHTRRSAWRKGDVVEIVSVVLR